MKEQADSDFRELEFSKIPSLGECWRKVLSQASCVQYEKGEYLYHRGELGVSLFFLDKGEVHMLRSTEDGREKIIWTAGPGSLVGETPLFEKVPWRNSLVAATNCTVYAFSRQCVLEKILPQEPELMIALFCSLASKVRLLCNQSVALSLNDLASRICKYLHLRWSPTNQKAGAASVCPGLNQQELANLLGVHRVTLNRVLRELEKAQILSRYSRDEVVIVNMERFQELAFQNE